MEPLVSIIIPVYNSEKFLQETITSALNQTWWNKEIIIVDDGSTDNSYFIAKKYESENVKVCRQLNKGGSAARNTGLKLAKGEYIQFLDADDLMQEDKIQKQMAVLQKNPDCIIGCKWIRFKGGIQNTIGGVGPELQIAKDLDPVTWLTIRHMMLIHCWLTPRKLIDKAGHWDESISFNDDGEFFYRVIAYAKRVLFLPETIVYYRTENVNSVSVLNSRSKYLSAYLAALSYKKTLLSLGHSKEVKEAIGNYFRELQFKFFPTDHDLFELCQEQPEIRYATLKWQSAGPSKILYKIFGWKNVRKVILWLRKKS